MTLSSLAYCFSSKTSKITYLNISSPLLVKRDIFVFKWRVPQVLCEAPESWGGLSDVELIIRCALKAFENNELLQDFLNGKQNNVYKAIIDEVMYDLAGRGIALKDHLSIPYGDIEMNRYRKGPALTADKCREITNIGLGDENALDRIFPPPK